MGGTDLCAGYIGRLFANTCVRKDSAIKTREPMKNIDWEHMNKWKMNMNK